MNRLRACVVAVSVHASSLALAASAPPRRPNVVVLLADDLRADALGAYGGRGVLTPNLDRLARSGTVFERAYIMGSDQPAVCTPSRAMLWTGRQLFRLQGGIPADAPLLGGILRQGGYDTYGVGKWHDERPAFNRAFADGARIFFGGMSSHTAVPTWDYDPSASYPKGAARVVAQHSSELFADAAIAAIEARAAGKQERPFLLYVAFTSPHDPRRARERFVRLHDPRRAPLPRNFLPQHPFDNGELDVRDERLAPRPRTPEVVQRHVADYRAMVSDLDHEVGRILGALERAGHGEDTLVVFAGDNGLALGSHGLLGKQNLYEHSIRVPLIVRGPGIPRGQRARGFAYLLDLFPTLCELTGTTAPEGLDGQSLVPMLRDPTRAKGRPSLFFAYRREQRAVRDERWKLIEYAVGGADRRQLFDLRADPDERRDLSGDPRAAAHLTRLQRELVAWRTRLADPAAVRSSIRVTRTTVETLTNPLGIDTPRPRLAWVMESPERGRRQTAYQIAADGWDTGKVTSSQQNQIPWGGPALQAGQRITWSVRVWDDQDRASEWSAPAVFEMGLLQPADWHGRWIAATDRLPSPPQVVPMPRNGRWIWSRDGGGEAHLRRTFVIPAGRTIKKATAVLAADDRATLSINGHEALRAEGTKSFAVASIAEWLQPGENVATLDASNAEGTAGILGQLSVELAEGPPLLLPTDAQWTPAQVVTEPRWGHVALGLQVDPAPYLRRTFTVGKPVASARLYLSAVGYGELHLNGAKVSDHVLDPGFTRFDRRVLYVTHDVTAALRRGRNTVGVVLGNGHYNQHAQDVWRFQVAPWRNTPRLLMELRIRYADGTKQTVTSGGDWELSTGPIVSDGLRNGEVYDARLDWQRGPWKPAVEVSAPGGVLSAQMLAPMKVTETRKPVKVTETRPGVWLVDFGQNLAGWARLTVSGAAGTRVTLRYGERLNVDGGLDQSSLDKHLEQGAFQTDTYILKGQGTEVWEPRFTYHGFQYVEVTGVEKAPTLEARVVHTAFEQTGRFASSNELFNKIFASTLWSYRGNFHSIPTDCPQREKNGWTADAHLAAEQAMFTFDNAAGYTKWVRDLRDEMKETGELPGIVPTGGWGYAWGNGPAWDSALFLIPWYQYLYTGDRQILTDSYAHFQRYLDYLGSRDYFKANPAGWLGDWVPAHDRTPEAVTHAGYHAEDARIAAVTARLLGRADEAVRFDAQAVGVKRRFREKFFDAATGKVASDQQTALSAALMQGLVDDKDRARVFQRLVASIAARKNHLDTGVLGAKYLPWVLTEGGRADLFYQVANQRDFPGWGAWFGQGATTLWEDWVGDASRNHVFLGDITAWFFRALGGINPDPAAPGFERIVFEPRFIGDLTWVEAETRSVRGRIATSWRRTGNTIELRVTVPVNSTGVVRLPGGKVHEVGSGTTTFIVTPR